MMVELPTCRIEPTVRPFIKSDVEFFRPIIITIKISHVKRNSAIFTSMTT